MATVTITIPDTLIGRIINAVNAKFPQYSSLSPSEAFQAVTADKWREILTNYEAQLAQDEGQIATAAATQAAIEKAAADLTAIGWS